MHRRMPIMLTMAWVRVYSELPKSGNTRPTHGASTICMATYRNGARTGTGITRPGQQPILSVLRMAAPPASYAVVPGATRRTTPVPRFGTGTGPPTAASSWASASVSDRPASSGARTPGAAGQKAEPARGATGTERSSARMAKANFCPIRLERMHASFRMSGDVGSRRSRHLQVALPGSQLFQSPYEIASRFLCVCPSIFARMPSQPPHRDRSACGSFILPIILFAILIFHDFSLVQGKGSTLLW